MVWRAALRFQVYRVSGVSMCPSTPKPYSNPNQEDLDSLDLDFSLRGLRTD